MSERAEDESLFATPLHEMWRRHAIRQLVGAGLFGPTQRDREEAAIHGCPWTAEYLAEVDARIAATPASSAPTASPP